MCSSFNFFRLSKVRIKVGSAWLTLIDKRSTSIKFEKILKQSTFCSKSVFKVLIFIKFLYAFHLSNNYFFCLFLLFRRRKSFADSECREILLSFSIKRYLWDILCDLKAITQCWNFMKLRNNYILDNFKLKNILFFFLKLRKIKNFKTKSLNYFR